MPPLPTSPIQTLSDQGFHGSYLASDIEFLLRPLTEQELTPVTVAEKEHLIQNGLKHYSDLITQEESPSDVHLSLFEQAKKNGGARMATEVQQLALALLQHQNKDVTASAAQKNNKASVLSENTVKEQPIVLVSLVRAGVPLGILLTRALRRLNQTVAHYGISIIRDRDIDKKALELIIKKHGSENVFFVDGWTGKGAIANQLHESLKDDSRFPDQQQRLITLADPCGKAWLAASGDDWLIPSGILGATISGLTSRTIYTSDDGFHGCKHWDHLAAYDQSKSFIEEIETIIASMTAEQLNSLKPAKWTAQDQRQHQETAEKVIDAIANQYDISNINRIKPGIAEATRAILRRVPQCVLIRTKDDPDIELLLHLAAMKKVVIKEVGEALGHYRAITIIKKVTKNN